MSRHDWGMPCPIPSQALDRPPAGQTTRSSASALNTCSPVVPQPSEGLPQGTPHWPRAQRTAPPGHWAQGQEVSLGAAPSQQFPKASVSTDWETGWEVEAGSSRRPELHSDSQYYSHPCEHGGDRDDPLGPSL